MERQDKVSALRNQAVEAIATEDGYTADDVKGAFSSLEKSIVRSRVVSGKPRIDGRATDTVRGLEMSVGVLKRTHGSSLFTRLTGEYKDNFLLHYNFPPYCVGEAGFMGSPKRREIGHGKLAKRGVAACMPNVDDFPYTVRLVSEITESNGSSSMASVCGSSLALMDAGVPLKSPVAGIAMGLVKEGDTSSATKITSATWTSK